MKLKVIETVFKYFVIDAILIFVVFVSLLPLEIQKQVFVVGSFLPLLSGGEDSSN
jgi:hypothetical protein